MKDGLQQFEFSTHSYSADYESNSPALGLDGRTLQILLWIIL